MATGADDRACHGVQLQDPALCFRAGQVIRPVLGITMGPPALISRLNIDGVLVYSAPRGGPAGDAGVQGCQRSQFGDLVVGAYFITPQALYSVFRLHHVSI